MANTVNIGKAARATAGRGQRGYGGRGYRAIGLAAIAVVVLGLAGGAIYSRMRPAAVPAAAPSAAVNPYWAYVEDVRIDAPQSVFSNPFAYDTHVYTEWDFREDRRTLVPTDASTTSDYRWGFPGYSAPVAPVTPAPATIDFGPVECGSVPCVGPVPAFDWEQQERTQVAPGPVPSPQVSIPGPWLGTCRAGNADCLPDGDIILGVVPTAPPAYSGPPYGDFVPGGDY